MTQILGFAGRKQSGKNTSCNFIVGLEMLSLGIVKNEISIMDNGKLYISDILGDDEHKGILDLLSNNVHVLQFLQNEVHPYVKIYSYADLLKQEVCMKILGLTHEQCYGTDEQKDSLTHILWENMPGVTTDKTPQRGMIYHPPGLMTARELMQYIGTEIFRKIYGNIWVDALIRKINQEQPDLALVCDVRFPNEVEGIQVAGGKVIRLTRCINPEAAHDSEIALDKNNFDWTKFDCIIDNANLDIEKTNSYIYNQLLQWNWISEIEH